MWTWVHALIVLDRPIKKIDEKTGRLALSYGENFKNSARRHHKAATELYDSAAAGAQPGCRAVAGYLYGLSGELAVKQMMRASGMQPLPKRSDDPFYAHFPSLKTLLKECGEGRRFGELRKIAEDNQLFQNWSTNMRYAPTGEIQDNWVLAWKQSSKELIEKMDL